MSIEQQNYPGEAVSSERESITASEQETPNYEVLNPDGLDLKLPSNTRELVLGASKEVLSLGKEVLQGSGRAILRMPYFYARISTRLRDIPKVLTAPVSEVRYASSITADKVKELKTTVGFEVGRISKRIKESVGAFMDGTRGLLNKIENNLDAQKIQALEERITILEKRKDELYKKLSVTVGKRNWGERRAEKVLPAELPLINKEIELLRNQIGEMMSKGLPEFTLENVQKQLEPEPIARPKETEPLKPIAKREEVPVDESRNENSPEGVEDNIEGVIELISQLPLNDIEKQTLKNKAREGLDDDFLESLEAAIDSEFDRLKKELWTAHKKAYGNGELTKLWQDLEALKTKFESDCASVQEEVSELVSQSQEKLDEIETDEVRHNLSLLK